MTIQESYAKGFCKVAEAYGVDPEQLYKYAGGISPRIEKLLFGTRALTGNNRNIVKGIERSARRSVSEQKKTILELLSRDARAHYPTLGRNPSKQQLLEAVRTANGMGIMNTPEFARYMKTQQMHDIALRALQRGGRFRPRRPPMASLEAWGKDVTPNKIPFGRSATIDPAYTQGIQQRITDVLKAKRGGGRGGMPRNAEEFIADLKHEMQAVPKKALPPKKV